MVGCGIGCTRSISARYLWTLIVSSVVEQDTPTNTEHGTPRGGLPLDAAEMLNLES
jgi:hypothetical protein